MTRYTFFRESDMLNIGDEVFCRGGYTPVTDFKNDKHYHLKSGAVITREDLIRRTEFLEGCLKDLKSQGVINVTAEDLILLSAQAEVIAPFASLFVNEDRLLQFKALLPYLLDMKYEKILEIDSHIVYKTMLKDQRFFVVSKKGEPLVRPKLYEKLSEALDDVNL